MARGLGALAAAIFLLPSAQQRPPYVRVASPVHRAATTAAAYRLRSLRTGTAPTSISKAVRGVKLTLSIPRRSYPRNALVKVKVTLQNVSRRTVLVGETSATECGQEGPGVEVLDGTGSVLYPPAVPWIMASCGGIRLPVPLSPGRSLHHAMLTILRGPVVRGVASIGARGSAHEVATPPVHITFTTEPPPTLAVLTSPTLQLQITPSQPMTSKTVYFIDGILCPGSSPNAVLYGTASPAWERGSILADGRFHALAACPTPVRWVFAAGWLNHPAVSLDYPPQQSRHGSRIRMRSNGGHSEGAIMVEPRGLQ